MWVFDLWKETDIDEKINNFLKDYYWKNDDFETFMCDESNLLVRVLYREKKRRE